MHIAIIADPIDNQKAGIHFYTKNLIKSLLIYDKKNQYTLIHSKENPFFKNTQNKIIKSHGALYEFFRKFYLIPSYLNKINPDIVLEPAHFGPYRLKKSIKRVTVIHDLTNFLTPQFHILKTNLVHKIFLPRTIKNADLIITPSKTTSQDLKNLFTKTKKIIHIYPGIDKQKNLNTKPVFQKPYLLHLGTLEPRKNLETLVQAFLELKKEKSIPHKLILAGQRGWKIKNLLKMANHPDIIITGYISNKKKNNLLINADILICPSHYEGFGLPPMEAMSLNIPTITSTGGSLGEIYKNITLTHPPKDKDILKKHILQILRNEEFRNNLIKKSKKYSEKFTWEIAGKKVIEALNSLKD